MVDENENRLGFRVVEVLPAQPMTDTGYTTLISVEVSNLGESPLDLEFFLPTILTSGRSVRTDCWGANSFQSGIVEPGQPVAIRFGVDSMKLLSIQHGDRFVFKWCERPGNELHHLEWEMTPENTCALVPLDQLEKRMKSLGFLKDGFEAMEREEYALSLKFFSKVLELDPHNVVAIGHRGLALSYMDQHEKAIEDYTSALDVNPAEKGWKLFRGISYFHLNRLEEARQDLESYLRECEPDEESRQRAEEYLAQCG